MHIICIANLSIGNCFYISSVSYYYYYYYYYYYERIRGSAITIETRLRAGRPGLDSREGSSRPDRPLGSTQSPCRIGTRGSFSGGKAARAWS